MAAPQARVIDPILMGVADTATGAAEPVWGKFLKDFTESEW